VILAAYLQGATELPERFATWGSIPSRDPDPAAVRELLRRGAVGLALAGANPVQVPAAGPRGRNETLWLIDEAAAAELPSAVRATAQQL